MHPTSILIDTNTLQCSKSGQITGTLVLQTGDIYFPARQWNDFIVVVLQWWLLEIRYMLTEREKGVFRFMDGDYEFWLRIPIEGASQIVLHDPSKAVPEIILAGDPNHIISAILMAANAVLRACRALKWETPDVSALDEA